MKDIKLKPIATVEASLLRLVEQNVEGMIRLLKEHHSNVKKWGTQAAPLVRELSSSVAHLEGILEEIEHLPKGFKPPPRREPEDAGAPA